MRETSRDYAAPHRPCAVSALNAIWGGLGRRWLSPLDATAWRAAAERAERTEAAGWDMMPFEVLAESLRGEARLNPLGRTIVSTRVVGAMRSRLRVETALAADPTIRQRAVVAPIVIVGLQRTGTTFLQRLLAAHPQLRAPCSWEVLNPAPLRRESGSERRIRAARQAAAAVSFLAPDFQAVHPIEPLQPEEEVVLFEEVGLSTGFEATLRVPGYAAWLEGQDQRPAYRWLLDVLRLLQGSGGGRWVLKTPHHLEFLDTLLEVFPDTRLVWTHRDPVTTVASFCSMVAHGYGLCSDVVDPAEIGAHWLAKTSRMVSEARAFRAAHPEVPVLDLDYGELVADPLGSVERIVGFAEASWDRAAQAAVEARRAESPARRYGRHRYEAGDFGLEAGQIAAAFAAYRQDRGFG